MGSTAIANTIAIVEVACITAGTALPPVTMISTLRRTNSAAISRKRSVRPSAQQYWIATVRPSIQSSSRSRCTKACWSETENTDLDQRRAESIFPAAVFDEILIAARQLAIVLSPVRHVFKLKAAQNLPALE